MIKKILIILSIFVLTACSNFKLGSMVYCHSNADCKFEQVAK